MTEDEKKIAETVSENTETVVANTETVNETSNDDTEVLTLAGVKTTVDFSKLTEEQLETMSDEQIAEAKAEFEKVKSTVEQTYSELTDVEKVFKARAKAKMKSVLSTAWGYAKTALIIYAAVVATIAVVKLF